MLQRFCVVAALLALTACGSSSSKETAIGAGDQDGVSSSRVTVPIVDVVPEVEEPAAEEETPMVHTVSYSGDSDLIATTQAGLTKLGYDPGRVDGLLGPKTRNAIRAYQTDHGLSVDGTPSAALERHILEQVD